MMGVVYTALGCVAIVIGLLGALLTGNVMQQLAALVFALLGVVVVYAERILARLSRD